MILPRRILRFLGIDPSPGARGERFAARHLKRQGYRILARNLRGRTGEIDILAQAPDGRTIVVVEVKTSEGALDARVAPELRVGRDKQRKLAELAMEMTRRLRLTDRPVRFDVIGVSLMPDGKHQARHHPAAFESPW